MSGQAKDGTTEKGGARKGLALRIALAVFSALVAGSLFYLSHGIYHPDTAATRALASDGDVRVDEEPGYVSFSDPDAGEGRGLILYQGAKVDAEAYAPLARSLAERGWVCAIVKSPFDIAFFNPNGADEVRRAFPQVRSWYVGGHSLGGVIASDYARGHSEELEGLVLLASYPLADLSDTRLQALTVYGDRDSVLSRDARSDAAGRLPEGSHEVIIAGGNHAQFGSYGPQDGDGEAAISAEQQVAQVVSAIDRLGR